MICISVKRQAYLTEMKLQSPHESLDHFHLLREQRITFIMFKILLTVMRIFKKVSTHLIKFI